MYPTPAGEAFQENGIWYQDYNIQDPVTGEVKVKRYKYINDNWVEHTKVDLAKKIPNTASGINLKKNVVNLDKCLVSLSKSNGMDLGAHRAKVAVVVDFSGSMRPLYKDGSVQRTLNRLVPLGLRFDDNGEIDVWLFNEGFRRLEGMDLTNYESYVNEIIMRSGERFGTTSYAPVLKDVVNRYTIEDPSDQPAFVIYITDGSNDDRVDTDAIIRKSSKYNIFIQFIGLGTYDDFKYLRKLDDLTGRAVDNTGFIPVKDFDKMNDNELYSELLRQYIDWLKVIRK